MSALSGPLQVVPDIDDQVTHPEHLQEVRDLNMMNRVGWVGYGSISFGVGVLMWCSLVQLGGVEFGFWFLMGVRWGKDLEVVRDLSET